MSTDVGEFAPRLVIDNKARESLSSLTYWELGEATHVWNRTYIRNQEACSWSRLSLQPILRCQISAELATRLFSINAEE